MTSIPIKRSRHGTLMCLLTLTLMALPSAFATTTFVTNIILDDYSDPFDTTGLAGSPGFLKAFPESPPGAVSMPSSQSVSTILTSGQTVGATRVATLTHLDPAYDPLRTKGNSSAFVNDDLGLGPKFIGLGNHTASPARLEVDYDFTTMAGGILDAGTGNTHVIVSVFETDGGDNVVDASLAFENALGNQSTRSLVDLGIDIAAIGNKLLEFNELAGVDFKQLTRAELVWENGGEAQYNGRIAAIGAGVFPPTSSAPEPAYAISLFSPLTIALSRRSRRT